MYQGYFGPFSSELGGFHENLTAVIRLLCRCRYKFPPPLNWNQDSFMHNAGLFHLTFVGVQIVILQLWLRFISTELFSATTAYY